MANKGTEGSFWDHLDILRTVIIKIIAVWCIISIIAFFFKDELFAFVLAPKSNDFILYRLLAAVCVHLHLTPPAQFDIQIINTGLAQQFMIHLKTAMCAGVILTAPYALYLLFGFVSPGLYENERSYASGIIVSGYVMFLVGTALSYFLIFPLTFQFLGNYRVADYVSNMITLESYMGTLIMMSLCMGIVCELPVVAWLLGKTGILTSGQMKRYRRHAVVVILSVAAIITPTSDVLTLLIVSAPIWLLYEAGIFIVRKVEAAPAMRVTNRH